jgi:heme/copper-type cytochrome/quinol oxidase subunit 2
MSIKRLTSGVAGAISGSLLYASSVLAAETGLSGSQTNLTTIGTNAGLSDAQSSNLPTLIGNIINVILGVLGIVFVVLVVYGGIQYMLAQGDPKKVEHGVAIIRQAIIGLVITVAAYAISNFVIDALITATTV